MASCLVNYQFCLSCMHITVIYNTIKGLMCTFRASCYSARLSWALVLTWVSPFVQDKNVGFVLGKNRLSRYDIHAEGALPSSITTGFKFYHGTIHALLPQNLDNKKFDSNKSLWLPYLICLRALSINPIDSLTMLNKNTYFLAFFKCFVLRLPSIEPRGSIMGVAIFA